MDLAPRVDLTAWTFALALLAEGLLLASLIVSIAAPVRRIWPPPGPGSWQFVWTWVWTAVAFLASVALAFLDYGSFVLDHIGWKIAGGILVVLGTALADWGVRTLGSHTSRGLGGEFRRRGPYRWSRNPQYLGDIAVVLGFILGFDSILLVISGLVGIACLFLAPLAEEPWLRERYGAEYERYRDEVPRFFGRSRRRR